MINYLGLDTECYIDTGELKLLAIQDIGIFYLNPVLSFYDIMNILKLNNKQYFCCYNLDYDIGAIIKSIFPLRDYKRIYLGLKTEHKGLTITYIPKKKAIITYKNYTIRIYDCYQFYAMSLKKASKTFLNKNKQDFNILNMQESKLDKVLYQALKYCYKDSILCGMLFNRMIKMFDKLGMNKDIEPLSQGFIAYQYFKEELSNINKVPFQELFKRAYKGGRFEVFKRGYFKKAFIYDIVSAYPYALTKIKDITKCSTYINSSYSKDSSFSVFYCDIDIPIDLKVSPFMLRIKNHCICPVGKINDIYIDKNEYELLINNDCKVNIKTAYHIKTINIYPFKKKIIKLFELKKRYPNDNQIYKICLSATYGKTCQIIKAFYRKKYTKIKTLINDTYYDKQYNELYFKLDKPSYTTNFPYASFITSFTRGQIYNDTKHCLKNIIAYFTDGIITTKRIKLPLSGKLGSYSLKVIKDLYMIGSGVYFFKFQNKQYLMFRGFPISEPKKIIKKILNSKVKKIQFKVMERVSLGKSLASHLEHDYNIIVPKTRILNLNFDNKRLWYDKIKSGKDLKKTMIESECIPFT